MEGQRGGGRVKGWWMVGWLVAWKLTLPQDQAMSYITKQRRIMLTQCDHNMNIM